MGKYLEYLLTIPNYFLKSLISIIEGKSDYIYTMDKIEEEYNNTNNLDESPTVIKINTFQSVIVDPFQGENVYNNSESDDEYYQC